ncbi:hypothetical protein HII36_52515 [Nonomuraea sp. NN258]|uniref:hypothetical protein n=1 Tax=Nonomuraea antri TaxID=2730852 RepID=UPI0015689180|nr:hypothetical protein [Nonomuraea antri]NRQ40389.1 hypothetical protein [Nonomuraea antri]
MTTLERRYRRLLLAYPRQYRLAHGDELLDVLLESAAPDQSVPAVREAAGLVLGGVRARIARLATGSVWAGGVHLGITAVSVANLAALLPYAAEIPWLVACSALATLAVLRGLTRVAFVLTAPAGAKAVAIAGGWQLFDVTLLPVYPGALTDQALFATSGPFSVGAAYAVVLLGLLALIGRGQKAGARSWWWPAAVLPLAWMGPAWPGVAGGLPLSVSRAGAELTVLGLAVVAAYLTRDLRWGLAAAIYLLVASIELAPHAYESALSRQHLAYWGLLVLLTLGTVAMPYRQRRHCLD